MGRQDNHERLRLYLFHPIEDLHAADAGKAQVQQDQVRAFLLDELEPCLPCLGRDDLVAFLSEDIVQHPADELFVIDDQDLCRHDCDPLTGKRTVTVVPLPSSLSM